MLLDGTVGGGAAEDIAMGFERRSRGQVSGCVGVFLWALKA